MIASHVLKRGATKVIAVVQKKKQTPSRSQKEETRLPKGRKQVIFQEKWRRIQSEVCKLHIQTGDHIS